jgi:arylsulfatase A-like enzyme
MHGSISNGFLFREDLPIYPELLRKNGYQTMASGKMHINPISRLPENSNKSREEYTKKDIDEPGEMPDSFPYCGFEKVEFVEGYKSQYLKMIKEKREDLWEAANHYPPEGHDPENPVDTWSNPIPLELHRSTWTADKTIELLEGREKGKPFLMHCSFFNPHHPFAPPAPYDEMYDPEDMPAPIPYEEGQFSALPDHFRKMYETKRGERGKSFKRHSEADWKKLKSHYYGMISLIDYSIGRVLDYLEDNGLMENTAIFFVSDHGELLGDHGLGLKGRCHYQGLIKVPFIFSYPKKFEAGRVVSSKVMTYDLMPTILDLAGVEKPKVTARSLIPLLNGDAKPRDAVLVEAFGDFNVRTMVYGPHKITAYSHTDEGEMFNLDDDPLEMNNLWESDTNLKLRLLQKLNQLQMDTVINQREEVGKW